MEFDIEYIRGMMNRLRELNNYKGYGEKVERSLFSLNPLAYDPVANDYFLYIQEDDYDTYPECYSGTLKEIEESVSKRISEIREYEDSLKKSEYECLLLKQKEIEAKKLELEKDGIFYFWNEL